MTLYGLAAWLAADADVGISWTISGPVLLALVALAGAVVAAWREAHGAKRAAQVPTVVSPSFEDEMRTGFRRVEAQLVELDRRMWEHVEHHDEPVRRRRST